MLFRSMLKPYFLSDTLNAPYLRMKNLGWISRYTKELNACVGFTVEGALLYLIGKQLQENTTPVDLNFVKKIVREGSKLQKAGLEEFLCEEALNGELQLSTALIDAGEPLLALCIRPLTYYLKTAGAEETLAQLLKETTDNDWIALNRLDAMLDELQLQVLRKQMLSKCIQHIKFKSQEETLLGLKAIKVLDDQEAKKHYAGIDFSLEFINDNERILAEFAHCEKRFANYDKALEFYQKSLNIELKTLGEEHSDVATTYNNIAVVWYNKSEYDKALEFYQKSLNIRLKTLGEEHPSVANSYNNIGLVWDKKGEYEKALEFYQKSLNIKLKTLGEEHPSVANSYNNIGLFWNKKGQYDKALEFYQKSLNIRLKTFGEVHPDVSTSYNNIAVVWHNKGEYDKALEFYNKSLNIRLKNLGEEHPSVATS